MRAQGKAGEHLGGDRGCGCERREKALTRGPGASVGEGGRRGCGVNGLSGERGAGLREWAAWGEQLGLARRKEKDGQGPALSAS